MADIKKDFTQLIGNTPMLELTRIGQELGLCARIAAKLEGFNPAGSAKDRAALYMIRSAEENGLLREGATIIEPTSGNTGIGLAAVAAARGYRVILTMPDTMSIERRTLLAAYGAEVVLTEGALGMNGAIDKARQLAAEIENSYIPSQFDNPANPQCHYETTGPELWAQTGGEADIFVAGVGTGGTLTGIGRFLKEQNPSVKIVAVEPASSPMLSRGRSGTHGLQGIGANFVPAVLDRSLIDEIITVTEEEAYAAGRMLVRREGILAGISGGAALHAAIVLAQREENVGRLITVLLPDVGDRYLSTPMYCGG
ncbi:MAG: cysteine synthase A [Ruminococcaceae bacterium]|nr:cysteine synthase A [Oscillospiraceae bacterium]